MERLNKLISEMLSGRVSVILYILMFIYLVPVAILGLIPALGFIEPSANVMLIGDNYTSVLAALAASIAAGAGVKAHNNAKELAQKHESLHNENQQLKQSIDDLHTKIDKLSR